MPEIAEVETIKKDLNTSCILRQKIKSVDIQYSSILNLPKSEFTKILLGNSILDVSRLGKYLIFKLDGYYLIMHLKMTGHLLLKDKDYLLQKHELVYFTFENMKKLIYFDPRRFGRLYIKKDLSILEKIGVDVLSSDFTIDEFSKKLRKKNKVIKTLLLDQHFVAGIGNIYADEILFDAKINPKKLSSKIDEEKIKQLYLSIKKVILKAVENRGTSLGKSKLNYTSINGEFGSNQNHLMIHTKKICPKCKTLVTKIKINQRTSYFCKICQK
jgi:formamidopyrimidine-DNA glycosylase